MKTEFISCDYCKRRIEQGQWIFELRVGTANDAITDANVMHSCAECLTTEELLRRDFNLIAGRRSPTHTFTAAAAVGTDSVDRYREGAGGFRLR